MLERAPSVLVVDDVEANLIAMEAQLADMDCEIVRASSGNDALRCLLKRPFALVLLDVHMPVMDGFEVARHMRGSPRTRDLPILFLTAMNECEESTLLAYGSGAVDILYKPVNASVLRSKVQVFLQLHASRQRLNDEIDAHKKTLEELEAFNYSVAHDLRAPLRPLAGFSQALMEDYGDVLDPGAKDYLSRIRTAAQRMAQLIDDLLRLSRVGRADVRRQRVDVTALAHAVVGSLRAGEPDREVAVTVAPGLDIDGDPRLLHIALENLLGNAWKFTRKEPKARIEMGVTRAGDGAPTFFVADNGAGFDASGATRLFQPFQRFDAAAEFEGTGIGLAIVQRVVRHHRGRVWAESAPGRGATVFFTLQPERGHAC